MGDGDRTITTDSTVGSGLTRPEAVIPLRMLHSPVRAFLGCVALTAFAVATAPAPADEGMWLFEKPPLDAVKGSLGIELTPKWLEHVRKSAVRFENGGSGSIVSADGLVMTNHHVGVDMIVKLSTQERDLLETGFLAATRADELKCPDLEVRVLWEVSDVTARVLATGSSSPAAAQAARKKAIADIESEGSADGLVGEVVTLYQGGQYHLYRYKSFTDVRLVFAPELKAAYFGGDTDNFEFPRFNLDCCFFRIYEQGAPVQAEHFLKWSANGAADNEPIFVAGHPGTTRRALTADHLRFIRDVDHPTRLDAMSRMEVAMQGFCGRDSESARTGIDDLLGLANGRKAYTGQLAGLLDPRLIASKVLQDERDALTTDRAAGAANRATLAAIAEAQSKHREVFALRYAVDLVARRSPLLRRTLLAVRAAAERSKPSGEQLAEFSDAQWPSTQLDLVSPEPVHDSLEIERLTQALTLLAGRRGGDDPMIVAILAGKGPRERATEAVIGTAMKEVAARESLAEASTDQIADSTDPMVRLALAIDGPSRRLRNIVETEVEPAERAAYAALADLRFKRDGDTVYPDATFSLRLSFGRIQGWQDGGATVPSFTTLGGTFARMDDRKGQKDFDLPPSWLAKRDTIAKDTPFNFSCTADIIGGNSGSPVINAAGEVVGLIFDGNIQSLAGAFVYEPAVNRAVAVDSRGIIEALQIIYNANGLVKELTGH